MCFECIKHTEIQCFTIFCSALLNGGTCFCVGKKLPTCYLHFIYTNKPIDYKRVSVENVGM